MTELTAEPISSVDDIQNIADLVTIRGLFTGSFCISDFEWDDDELYRSFLATVSDMELRNAYAAERDFALTEAKETVISSVIVALSDTCSRLGHHSPFTLSPDADQFLMMKNFDDISVVGKFFLVCVFFTAFDNASPLLNIAKKDLNKFRAEFARVFEVASCLVLAGLTESRVWYVGRSRSVKKLQRILQSFCHFVNDCSLRNIDDLDSYVRNSNDGGVDAIGVTAPAGKIGSAPMIYLLGATIQKSHRKNKIVSSIEKGRFKALFDKQPKIGFEGVFTVPFTADDVDKEYCRDADCRYVPRDALFDAMRRLDSQHELFALLRPQRKAISRWIEIVRKGVKLDLGPEFSHIA